MFSFQARSSNVGGGADQVERKALAVVDKLAADHVVPVRLGAADLAQETFVMYGAMEVPGLHAAALVPSVAARHVARNIVFKKLAGPGAQTSIGIALALPPGGQTSAAQRFHESVLEQPGT